MHVKICARNLYIRVKFKPELFICTGGRKVVREVLPYEKHRTCTRDTNSETMGTGLFFYAQFAPAPNRHAGTLHSVHSIACTSRRTAFF